MHYNIQSASLVEVSRREAVLGLAAMPVAVAASASVASAAPRADAATANILRARISALLEGYKGTVSIQERVRAVAHYLDQLMRTEVAPLWVTVDIEGDLHNYRFERPGLKMADCPSDPAASELDSLIDKADRAIECMSVAGLDDPACAQDRVDFEGLVSLRTSLAAMKSRRAA